MGIHIAVINQTDKNNFAWLEKAKRSGRSLDCLANYKRNYK